MTNMSEAQLAAIWSDRDSFTLNEASALWVGESPPHGWIDDPKHPNFDKNNLPTSSFHNINAFEHMLERLQKAIGDNKTGELKAKHFYPDYEYDDTGIRVGETDLNRPHPEKSIVKRGELKRWATTQANFPLFLFSPELQLKHLSAMEPAVLNKDLDYHSRELAIALEAWHHFYHQGHINPALSQHIRQIKEWIKEQYAADFTTRAIENKALERIATMVSRYKKKKYKDF